MSFRKAPSEEASAIRVRVRKYRQAKLSASVRVWSEAGSRPAEFPFALISDLLSWKFIDMEKILGEMFTPGREERHDFAV